jgi:hypothetical protein
VSVEAVVSRMMPGIRHQAADDDACRCRQYHRAARRTAGRRCLWSTNRAAEQVRRRLRQ